MPNKSFSLQKEEKDVSEPSFIISDFSKVGVAQTNLPTKRESQNVPKFNFSSLVDSMEMLDLVKEICNLSDPSKIIHTLSMGIVNLISVVQTGRLSTTCTTWHDIRSFFQE